MRTILVLLLAAVSTGGCTTLRAVAPGDLQAALGRLKTGDSISVRTADTWHEKVTVVSVSDASIQAQSPSGERVTFAKAEIAEMQVRTRAPGRTAALAAGIYVLGLSALCGNPFRGHANC